MSVKRDYKSAATWHKQRNGKRLQARKRGLLVLILTVVTAVGIGFGYYKNHAGEAAVATDIEVNPPRLTRIEANPPPTTELSARPKPKYDFYGLSNQQPILVEPQEEATPQKPRNPEKPVTAKIVNLSSPQSQPISTASRSSAPSRFIVQAGLFSTHNNADSVKAKIALLGLRAHIETTIAADGKTLRRVQLGPFANAAQAQATRQRLQENGIEAITVSLE